MLTPPHLTESCVQIYFLGHDFTPPYPPKNHLILRGACILCYNFF
jgi:hypothetical protein